MSFDTEFWQMQIEYEGSLLIFSSPEPKAHG